MCSSDVDYFSFFKRNEFNDGFLLAGKTEDALLAPNFPFPDSFQGLAFGATDSFFSS